MDDEEYVSLENLKKPSFRQDLQTSIDSLNQSINSLIGLFKEAADSMKLEERETELVSRKIDPIAEKLDIIMDQNKKIARGIVAVADMVEERLPKLKETLKPAPAPVARPMSMPSMPPPSMLPLSPPSAMSPPSAPGMRPMPLPPRPLPR